MSSFWNRNDRELRVYLHKKKIEKMPWALRNFSFTPNVSNPVEKAKDLGVSHSWAPWTNLTETWVENGMRTLNQTRELKYIIHHSLRRISKWSALCTASWAVSLSIVVMLKWFFSLLRSSYNFAGQTKFIRNVRAFVKFDGLIKLKTFQNRNETHIFWTY
jgi:hypothetical protein